MDYKISFGRDLAEVGRARRFVRQSLCGHACCDDATQVASELVANVIEHTGPGEGVLRLEVDGDGSVRVAVTDRGGDTTPHVTGKNFAERGRGVAIVADLAAEWRYSRCASGAEVWVRLAPPVAGRD